MTKAKKIAALTLNLQAAEAAFALADSLMDSWTLEDGAAAGAEIEARYDAARAQVTACRDALRGAQFAGRRVCPHAAALVSANID
jgi:hypothetical protein